MLAPFVLPTRFIGVCTALGLAIGMIGGGGTRLRCSPWDLRPDQFHQEGPGV